MGRYTGTSNRGSFSVGHLVVAKQVRRHLARQVVIVVLITSKIIRRISAVFVLSAEYPVQKQNNQQQQQQQKLEQNKPANTTLREYK